MARRIKFIEPIDYLSGKLSGNQKLEYAENNNPAYYAPLGKVNYAKNYKSRYIGVQVAATGRTYFSIKSKAATHMTNRAKKAMALMGGTGALVGAILHDKSTAIYQGIYAQWLKLQEYGSQYTLRKYMSDTIRQALETFQENINFAGPLTVVTIKNPWYDGTQTTGANISTGIIIKFWTQLHVDGITFTIDGATGVASDGYTIAESASIPVNSILNITSGTVGQNTYAKSNGRWMLDPNGEYALYDDAAIIANGKYTTTVEAPSA